MAKQLIVIWGNAFPCPKCNSMLAPAIKVSYAKVHIIADHAIEHFKRLHGFGDFTKDSIEWAHWWAQKEEHRTHGLPHITKALNAPSKKGFMNPLIVKEVTGAKRKFRKDKNCGKANEAQMYWPSTAKLSRRAELRAVDREVADLPTRLLSAEESVKLDYIIDKQFNVMTYRFHDNNWLIVVFFVHHRRTT